MSFGVSGFKDNCAIRKWVEINNETGLEPNMISLIVFHGSLVVLLLMMSLNCNETVKKIFQLVQHSKCCSASLSNSYTGTSFMKYLSLVIVCTTMRPIQLQAHSLIKRH